jgi:DNA-binding transcriptional MerR regulator
MQKREDLSRFRGDEYVGTTALVARAADVVPAFVPAKRRDVVRDVPSERIVRHYLKEGLLSPPLARRGTSSVYGYVHLLQIVAVKKLLAMGMTADQIRTILAGKTVGDLERLLDVREERPRERAEQGSAAEFLHSLLPGAQPAAREVRIEVEPGVAVLVARDHPIWNHPDAVSRLLRRVGAAARRTGGQGKKAKLL